MKADDDKRLKDLDPYFDLPRLLSERRGIDVVVPYFTQSAPLYFFAHSMRGAMHMALNPDGSFHRRGYRAQSLIVERQIRMLGARRVLEIGCGRGFNLLSLARRNSELAFVGIDLTPWHVRAGRLVAWRRRNLDIQEGDFHRLPYADDSFDLVFSVEAICHAADIYTVVEEVRRVLRPGGRFVTIEPWRGPRFETFAEAARNAVRLVETVFILPNLQEFDRWLERTTGLGFDLILSEDVTAATLPNLEKLRRQALRWRRISWGRAAMHRLAPHLIENALAAILLGEWFREGLSKAPGCYRITVMERRSERAGSEAEAETEGALPAIAQKGRDRAGSKSAALHGKRPRLVARYCLGDVEGERRGRTEIDRCFQSGRLGCLVGVPQPRGLMGVPAPPWV